MKLLVREIQTYPVINFPKYVSCHLHDIKKLEDPYYLLNLSLERSILRSQAELARVLYQFELV